MGKYEGKSRSKRRSRSRSKGRSKGKSKGKSVGKVGAMQKERARRRLQGTNRARASEQPGRQTNFNRKSSVQQYRKAWEVGDEWRVRAGGGRAKLFSRRRKCSKSSAQQPPRRQ